MVEGAESDARAEEERRINALMKGMAQAEGDDMFVSTAAVGSIVGLQSAEIQQMAEAYAEKSADLAAGKKPDKVMGAQAHQRRVAILKKQIATQEKRVQEVWGGVWQGEWLHILFSPQIQGRHDELLRRYTEAQSQLEEVGVNCYHMTVM